MELNLRDKVAVVAGASRGLGYAIARELALEGVNVSISARGREVRRAASALRTEAGVGVLPCQLDLTDGEALSAWLDQTIREFGGIDLLCVNSGGPPPGTFAEVGDDQWRKAFELLLLSAIRLIRGALPSMRARGRGSILLLTSSAVVEPIPALTLSNVVRASVAALSKSLADEFSGDGIRVNQLIPGRIATDRVKSLDEGRAARLGISIEEQEKRSFQTIPLGRYGKPNEFARAAAFLLSDAAAYITGATLRVDGGMIRSVF